MIIDSYHSATTMTHINSFLEYFGFDKISKKELKEGAIKIKL